MPTDPNTFQVPSAFSNNAINPAYTSFAPPSGSSGINFAGGSSQPYTINLTAPPQQPQYTGVNGFLGSPIGQLAVGGVGAGLSAYANSKQNQANIQSQQQISQAQLDQQYKNMLASLSQSLTQNAFQRAQAAARPIGEAQQYAAHTAKQNAILDLLGSGGYRPGNGAIASAMGSLPSITSDALARLRNSLSEGATQNALSQRDKDILAINPNAATTDLSAYFGGGQPSPLMQSLAGSVNDYRTQAQNQMSDSESYARRLLQAAIDGGNFGPSSVGGSSTANPFPQAPNGPSSNAATKSAAPGSLPLGATPTQPNATQPGVAPAQSGAIPRAQPSVADAAHGQPQWGDTYWAQMTNPEALASVSTNETHKAHDYYGGKDAPHVDQLTPQMQQALQKNYGVSVSQDDVKDLIKKGWQYGQPAPDGYEYDRHTGLLTKKSSTWGKIAKIASIAAPIAATVLTSGAASPWLVASIGAGTGALAGAADGGGLKGALIGGAFGAASGALPGSTGNLGAMTGKQIAVNAAEQAGLGAAKGAITGGAEGALKGAAFGAAGAGLAGAAGNLAPQTAPLVNRIAAQAGTQAAFGALTGGTQGALFGAASGGLGAGFNSAAADPTNKRAQYFALLAQRAPQLYGAVR